MPNHPIKINHILIIIINNHLKTLKNIQIINNKVRKLEDKKLSFIVNLINILIQVNLKKNICKIIIKKNYHLLIILQKNYHNFKYYIINNYNIWDNLQINKKKD
jgi:hypothetical protein